MAQVLDRSNSDESDGHGQKQLKPDISNTTNDTSLSSSSSSERTPLLPRYTDDPPHEQRPASSQHRAVSESWSKFIKLIKRVLWRISPLLFFLAILVMIVHLSQLKELREEITKAPKLTIEEVSLDSLHSDGIKVRVIGYIQMDYDNALNGGGNSFRNSIIKAFAGLVNSIDVDEQQISLYFDQNYPSEPPQQQSQGPNIRENDLVRTANATIPPITVDISNLHNTSFDFIVMLNDFGSPVVMGTIAQKLLANEVVRFKAFSQLPIAKWGISFGRVDVTLDQILNPNGDNDDDDGNNGEGLNIKVQDINVSALPATNKDDDDTGLRIVAQLSSDYRFAMEAEIPSIIWQLKIPGCVDGKNPLVPDDDEFQQELSGDNSLLVSEGRTYAIHLLPYSLLNITVASNLSQLPINLLFPCENSTKSPLDSFVNKYLSGETNNVTIEGYSSQDPTLPSWFADIVQAISFTFPFKGKTSDDDLIKNLEFKDFRLSFPGNEPPWGQPHQSRVSATVRVTIRTPQSINLDPEVPLEVPYTRGQADLFSEGKIFAHIDIDDWIPCTTELGEDETNTYMIEFDIDSVPVQVIDQNVFGKVMREVLVAGSSPIRVEAIVDAEVVAPLGQLVFTDLPAQGDTVIRSSQL